MSKSYLLVAAIVAIGIFYLTITAYGNARYDAGVLKGKLDAAEEYMLGKEELDKIRDKRPDDAGLILRLRDGTF